MIEVVCGVIRDGSGRVLACRRGAGRHLGGLWEFPGGKVEQDELPEEALARELYEELGIFVTVGPRLDPVVKWTDGIVTICLRAFWCTVCSGEPMAIEHAEIRWGEPSELEALEWAEADVPFLQEILSAYL